MLSLKQLFMSTKIFSINLDSRDNHLVFASQLQTTLFRTIITGILCLNEERTLFSEFREKC